MASAIVGFIDMDCFYVAVERRRDPSLHGVPCAVVQYNSRQAGGAPTLPADACRRVSGSSGGIIAVSYEARRRGVTRQMRCHEAKQICPEIILVQVPTAFGKADLSIYKDAGDSVVDLLARRATACEKRSVDEVAIDITAEADRLLQERSWEGSILPAVKKASHLADSAESCAASAFSRDETRKGHQAQQSYKMPCEVAEAQKSNDGWSDAPHWPNVCRRLAAGAVVVAELRASVEQELGFTCSGGVAENKILAKLGCGLHKPNQQTIVLPNAVETLLRDLPLERLPGLGGDLGAQVKKRFNVSKASELARVPFHQLEADFPRQASFLLELAEGRHNDPVQDREHRQSISSGKTFFGHLQLNTEKDVQHWLHELACELHKRYMLELARHRRSPTRISMSVGLGGHGGGMAGTALASSRQMPLDLGRNGTVMQVTNAAHACFRRWLSSTDRHDGSLGVTSLGLSLSGMQSVDTNSSLVRFFHAVTTQPAPIVEVPSSAVCLIDVESDAASPGAEGELLSSTTSTRQSERAGGHITDNEFLDPSRIDPETLAALPPEIRAEVEAEMRRVSASAHPPPKRRRVNSISAFFRQKDAADGG